MSIIDEHIDCPDERTYYQSSGNTTCYRIRWHQTQQCYAYREDAQ